MLIAVIHKASLGEAAVLAARLGSGPDAGLYDLIELRLDACADLDLEALATMSLPLPAIFTLRAQREGGAATMPEAERLALLEKLAALKPAYLDVEAFVPAEAIARIRAVSPETTLILSSHNFRETPENLDAVLEPMQAKADGVIYKIAAMAQSTPDALRMLEFCRNASGRGIRLIGISMGEYGESTRILAPVFHTGLCYCPVEESTAPGQVDAITLREVYGFSRLNRDTAIYGLLGDPVAQSVGHRYHNRQNAESGENAVYVKWRVTRDETAEVLPRLARLGVRGLSVTMPLKEAVLPLVAHVDENGRDIGAVNTLKLEHNGYAGTNTDGPGALDALVASDVSVALVASNVSGALVASNVSGALVASNVSDASGGLVPDIRGLNVAVLGAGGAARAVIHEALCRGATVTVYNRSTDKVLPGGLSPRPLTDLKDLATRPCDLFINTLPFDLHFDYQSIPLCPGIVAYDLSYGKPSRFLAVAEQKGCPTLDGRGMFEAQAKRQRAWWGLKRTPQTGAEPSEA